jgi:hypothetical protein
VVPPLAIIRVVDALAVIGVVAVTARAGSKIAALVSTARRRDLTRPWFMGIFLPCAMNGSPHSLLAAESG